LPNVFAEDSALPPSSGFLEQSLDAAFFELLPPVQFRPPTLQLQFLLSPEPGFRLLTLAILRRPSPGNSTLTHLCN
jgi:hypothetical protein